MKKQQRVSRFFPPNSSDDDKYYRIENEDGIYFFCYFQKMNYLSWVDESGKSRKSLYDWIYEAMTSMHFSGFLAGEKLTSYQLEKMCQRMECKLTQFSYDIDVSLACIGDKVITFKLTEYYYEFQEDRYGNSWHERRYGTPEFVEFNADLYAQFLVEQKIRNVEGWFKYNYLKLKS